MLCMIWLTGIMQSLLLPIMVLQARVGVKPYSSSLQKYSVYYLSNYSDIVAMYLPTQTSNVHEPIFPAASVAMQVTVLVPSVKLPSQVISPAVEGLSQVTSPLQVTCGDESKLSSTSLSAKVQDISFDDSMMSIAGHTMVGSS